MNYFMNCFVWISFAAQSPAAVTIDNFNVGDLEFSASDSISQVGLDPNAVLGGNRTVTANALRSSQMNVRIDSMAGKFSFTSEDFGYFSITYRLDSIPQMDFMADGSSAFLLDFSFVDPGFWRGSYGLQVDGKSYSFSRSLFDIAGPGTIKIPFSAFTAENSFRPSEIVISGSRVEAGLRLELSSITTIPEPGPGFVLMSGAILGAMRRRRH